MGDWVKTYERAEDATLEYLEKSLKEFLAKQKASQATTGTTTTSNTEKDQD